MRITNVWIIMKVINITNNDYGLYYIEAWWIFIMITKNIKNHTDNY